MEKPIPNSFNNKPVFFHIPKNAGTYIFNRLFVYSLVFNQFCDKKYNRRIDVFKGSDIAYRIICIDREDVCNQSDKIRKFSDRVFEINFKDCTKELLEGIYVFAIVVSDIAFSCYEEEFFKLFPKDQSFYKFISFREPFNRAKSIYNYSQSERSSHEKIHNVFEGLSFEEYICSKKFEESWLVKKILGLDDEHDVTQVEFNKACELLQDFDIFDVQESESAIEQIIKKTYKITKYDDQDVYNIWPDVKNEAKKEKTLTLEELNKDCQDIFLEKSFWDKKIYDKYTKQDSLKKTKVINCFYDGSTSGFGDFLRGSLNLYGHCLSQGLDFDIDISCHRIRKFFKPRKYSGCRYFNIHDCQKAANQNTHFLHASKAQFDGLLKEEPIPTKKFAFTNFHPCLLAGDIINYLNKMPPIPRRIRNWFKNNLNFSDNIKQAVETELERKGLKEGEFDVLHFRIGDTESYSENFEKSNLSPRYEQCYNICKEHFEKNQKPIVVLSDSNDFKEFLQNQRNKNLNIFHLKSSHTQNQPADFEGYIDYDDENLFYNVFDMAILSCANQVESYTIYYHGSGFAYWVCKIHDVPIKLKILTNEGFPEKHKT